MLENAAITPDPARLEAARTVVRGFLDRKRRWTRALFVIAALYEAGFFGAMLFLFDFSDSFYWFIFFGVCFVYAPLITFVIRDTVMIDRLYYRLVLELGFVDGDGDDGGSAEGGSAANGLEPQKDSERDQARSFLSKKDRWAKVLFVASGVFKVGFGAAVLLCMDFTSRLHWFLLFGFLGIYAPLILSTWRNTFAIDRVYYELVDVLKYRGRSSVEPRARRAP